MKSSPFFALAAAALLGLAGCGDRPPQPPDFAEAFPNLPLPPRARLVSTSGGANALQLTMSSSATVEQVARYYESVFAKAPWRLVNKAKGPGGSVILLGEQSGRPLWVTVRRAGAATEVQLAGAVPASADSAKAGAKPPAAPPAKPAS